MTATTPDCALLSLYVYSVENNALNRPSIPRAWSLFEIEKDSQ